MTFVLPMRSIHAIMRSEKNRLLPRADRLSGRIDSLQRRLNGSRPAFNAQQIKDLIAELAEECKRIEQAPTWPIDSSIRRRFNLSNAALFLPFIGYAVGGTSFWQQLANAIQGIGK